MADEEEGGVPLLTFPDGTDSWSTGEVFERLHTLRFIHRILTWGMATAGVVAAIAYGMLDKIETGPGSEPFSHWSWYVLAIPILIIFLVKLADEAWEYNMMGIYRSLYFFAGWIYGLVLVGLAIWSLIERWVFCPDPPFDDTPWCTDGAASPIDWEYNFWFFTIVAEILLVFVHMLVFNMIGKRIKLLQHPMTGLTHEAIVRELYSSHGPRYITSIGSRAPGSTVADVYKQL